MCFQTEVVPAVQSEVSLAFGQEIVFEGGLIAGLKARLAAGSGGPTADSAAHSAHSAGGAFPQPTASNTGVKVESQTGRRNENEGGISTQVPISNALGIDTWSCVFRKVSARHWSDVLDELPERWQSGWVPRRGHNGLAEGMLHEPTGCRVSFGIERTTKEQMTFVYLTGDGLRDLGQSKFRIFLRWVLGHGGYSTRYDPAFDVVDGSMKLAEVKASANSGHCCRVKLKSVGGQWEGPNCSEGETINFGGKSAEKRLRVYDKGLETGATIVPDVWLRYECQVRGEMAKEVDRFFLAEGRLESDEAFTKAVGELLGGTFEFREVKDRDKDRHLKNRALVGWFQRVLERVGSAKLAGIVRASPKLKSWLLWIMHGGVAGQMQAFRDACVNAGCERMYESFLAELHGAENVLMSDSQKARARDGLLAMQDEWVDMLGTLPPELAEEVDGEVWPADSAPWDVVEVCHAGA